MWKMAEKNNLKILEMVESGRRKYISLNIALSTTVSKGFIIAIVLAIIVVLSIIDHRHQSKATFAAAPSAPGMC